ncbi:MAG: hypothetical protein RLN85_00265, partial [Pseudomonadales bacterium]
NIYKIIVDEVLSHVPDSVTAVHYVERNDVDPIWKFYQLYDGWVSQHIGETLAKVILLDNHRHSA